MSSYLKNRLIIFISGIIAVVVGFVFVTGVSRGPIADAGGYTIISYNQAYLISGIILLIVGIILLILIAYQVGKARFGKRIVSNRN